MIHDITFFEKVHAKKSQSSSCGSGAPKAAAPEQHPEAEQWLREFRGNRLSNTTCLTHVFFKRGE